MQGENKTSMTEAERNIFQFESGSIPFYKIVLTGGPCAGKTTALARVSSYLRERGYEVISCPEVYTILASNGLSGGFYATEGMDEVIQNTVLDVQMSLEDSLSNVLKARGKPAVLLCDRGPMDGKAYLSDDKWSKILDSRGFSEVDLRDKRYNAIIHMVSAADGAREFYQLDNNTARSETPEEACALDKQTQRCWIGHPQMYGRSNESAPFHLPKITISLFFDCLHAYDTVGMSLTIPLTLKQSCSGWLNLLQSSSDCQPTCHVDRQSIYYGQNQMCHDSLRTLTTTYLKWRRYVSDRAVHLLHLQ